MSTNAIDHWKQNLPTYRKNARQTNRKKNNGQFSVGDNNFCNLELHL